MYPSFLYRRIYSIVNLYKIIVYERIIRKIELCKTQKCKN